MIRAALRSSGRRVSQLFASERFEGSHQAVVRAVLEGRADTGATYCHTEAGRGIVHGGWGDARVRVLLDYGPIPADVLAVGMQVEGPMIQRLRQLFVSPGEPTVATAACELFEAEGFVRAEPAHFAPLAGLGRSEGCRGAGRSLSERVGALGERQENAALADQLQCVHRAGALVRCPCRRRRVLCPRPAAPGDAQRHRSGESHPDTEPTSPTRHQADAHEQPAVPERYCQRSGALP